MKALISTNEPVLSGYRVAQVETNNNAFEVAEGLFWVDCDDDTQADVFWFDPTDNKIKLIPVPVTVQPTTTGTQTL